MSLQKQTVTESENFFGEVIYAYTRAQAIADGCLVDVSETAQETGFKFPVALTRAVWSDCVEWDDEDSRRQTHQDVAGRLWDVLYMGMIAARANRTSSSQQVLYHLVRVPRGGHATLPRRVTLKLHIGGGDNGEPVITIMQPNED